MKKLISVFLLLSFIVVLSAQLLDDLNKSDNNSIKNDVIEVKYQKKSAKKAMLFSAIFPGAGQFYIERKTITAYIFPVIEIALITGLLYYDNEGNKKEDSYKKYALENYDRGRQIIVQNDMIEQPQSSVIYTSEHFRLDANNTQHFFEDIGKYNKYIFGWNDWYNMYVDNSTGTPIIHWEFDGNTWIGNRPIANPTDEPSIISQNRQNYIKMRKDAETQYDKSNNFMYLVLANHFVSSFDALRVAKKYNRNYISMNNIKSNFYTSVRQNKFTPFYQISVSF